MAQIVGTETVKNALLVKSNAAIESVDDAETGHADLDARLDAMDNAMAALAAGSGVVVSSNDTTVGFLNGKLVVGEGLDFTENNDGGDETLTIALGNVAAANIDFQAFALSIM